MKKGRDVSVAAVLIIVIAFFLAAATILACVKLPTFREMVRQLISVIEY
jgi:hypothetical protein